MEPRPAALRENRLSLVSLVKQLDGYATNGRNPSVTQPVSFFDWSSDEDDSYDDELPVINKLRVSRRRATERKDHSSRHSVEEGKDRHGASSQLAEKVDLRKIADTNSGGTSLPTENDHSKTAESPAKGKHRLPGNAQNTIPVHKHGRRFSAIPPVTNNSDGPPIASAELPAEVPGAGGHHWRRNSDVANRYSFINFSNDAVQHTSSSTGEPQSFLGMPFLVENHIATSRQLPSISPIAEISRRFSLSLKKAPWRYPTIAGQPSVIEHPSEQDVAISSPIPPASARSRQRTFRDLKSKLQLISSPRRPESLSKASASSGSASVTPSDGALAINVINITQEVQPSSVGQLDSPHIKDLALAERGIQVLPSAGDDVFTPTPVGSSKFPRAGMTEIEEGRWKEVVNITSQRIRQEEKDGQILPRKELKLGEQSTGKGTKELVEQNNNQTTPRSIKPVKSIDELAERDLECVAAKNGVTDWRKIRHLLLLDQIQAGTKIALPESSASDEQRIPGVIRLVKSIDELAERDLECIAANNGVEDWKKLCELLLSDKELVGTTSTTRASNPFNGDMSSSPEQSRADRRANIERSLYGLEGRQHPGTVIKREPIGLGITNDHDIVVRDFACVAVNGNIPVESDAASICSLITPDKLAKCFNHDFDSQLNTLALEANRYLKNKEQIGDSNRTAIGDLAFNDRTPVPAGEKSVGYSTPLVSGNILRKQDPQSPGKIKVTDSLRRKMNEVKAQREQNLETLGAHPCLRVAVPQSNQLGTTHSLPDLYRNPLIGLTRVESSNNSFTSPGGRSMMYLTELCSSTRSSLTTDTSLYSSCTTNEIEKDLLPYPLANVAREGREHVMGTSTFSPSTDTMDEQVANAARSAKRHPFLSASNTIHACPSGVHSLQDDVGSQSNKPRNSIREAMLRAPIEQGGVGLYDEDVSSRSMSAPVSQQEFRSKLLASNVRIHKSPIDPTFRGSLLLKKEPEIGAGSREALRNISSRRQVPGFHPEESLRSSTQKQKVSRTKSQRHTATNGSTIQIDIDEVINHWQQGSPKFDTGIQHEQAKNQTYDSQALRREFQLPQLCGQKREEPKHPNHPYEWHAVKLMCRHVHNPSSMTPKTPEMPMQQALSMSSLEAQYFVGSPYDNRQSPKMCAREGCQSYCCFYGKMDALAQSQATDVLLASVSRNAKGTCSLLRVRRPNGIEEWDAFLKCSHCQKMFCPECSWRCAEILCQDVLCHGCMTSTCKCPTHD